MTSPEIQEEIFADWCLLDLQAFSEWNGRIAFCRAGKEQKVKNRDARSLGGGEA